MSKRPLLGAAAALLLAGPAGAQEMPADPAGSEAIDRIGVGVGIGHHHYQGELPPTAGITSDSLYQLDALWTDGTGEQLRLADLSPHPVVAAMIYTSCEYACPLIVGKMLEIYDGLDEKVRSDTRFVLFSFDPERDTPAQLNPYKKARGIDKDEWIVLTADDDAARELAVALGVRYRPTPDGEFAHSNIITVIDRQGVPSFQSLRLDDPATEAIAAVAQAHRH